MIELGYTPDVWLDQPSAPANLSTCTGLLGLTPWQAVRSFAFPSVQPWRDWEIACYGTPSFRRFKSNRFHNAATICQGPHRLEAQDIALSRR
jgi:hypothetical protein